MSYKRSLKSIRGKGLGLLESTGLKESIPHVCEKYGVSIILLYDGKRFHYTQGHAPNIFNIIEAEISKVSVEVKAQNREPLEYLLKHLKPFGLEEVRTLPKMIEEALSYLKSRMSYLLPQWIYRHP